MKHLYRFLFLISIFIFSSERFYAQLISGNSFMQGSFVEVGVTPCGSYGTSPAPPFGYHPRSPGGGLGFVADFGRDGSGVLPHRRPARFLSARRSRRGLLNPHDACTITAPGPSRPPLSRDIESGFALSTTPPV